LIIAETLSGMKVAPHSQLGTLRPATPSP